MTLMLMEIADHSDSLSAYDRGVSSTHTRLPSPQRGRGVGGEGESRGGSQFQRILSHRNLGSPSTGNAHSVLRPLTPSPSPALGRGGPTFSEVLVRGLQSSLRLCVSAVAFALLLTAVGLAARPKTSGENKPSL